MYLCTKFYTAMKKILLLLLLYPFILFGQISDDFSDGDFSQNPTWMGTVDKFIVNDKGQLQLNAETAGTAWIATRVTEYETMEWRFWFREAFAPSGNNFTDVWLCADNANLSQSAQGYFLRFGEAGSSDAIELFCKDAEGERSVCRGREGAIASSFSVAIKAICDREGHWILLTCYDDSGAYILEAEGQDESLDRAGWFGLCATYTASNAKKVYLDDVFVGLHIPDKEPPMLLSSKTLSPSCLQLSFDEALLEVTALSPVHYSVDHGMGYPLTVSYGANAATILLGYERNFVTGIEYQLTVSRLKDLWGNTMQFDVTISFRLPDEVDEGDVLINEILFNPISPGVEYVELYNNTNKTFDLSTLKLGVIKESFPNPPDTTLKAICTNSRLFMPQTYVLLSTNSEIVGQQYDCPTDNFVQMASFPSYVNSGGTALLVDQDGLLVDRMAYSEEMHFPLLNETKGVALERISFEHPSMDADNWHSAAESVHFGTPGYENSMRQNAGPSNDEITISPDVFSPDGDGIDDVCFVNYRFDEVGYTMNTYIFNVAGQLVRHLAKGELVGQEGSLIWNGTDNGGDRVPIGVYVIVTEVFSMQGKVKQFKNAAVVATR